MRRKKKKKAARDPRINARSMGLRQYLLILLISNGLSATLIQIYGRIHDQVTHTSSYGRDWQSLPLLLSVGGYVIFASVILSLIFVRYRRFILSRKMDVLYDAARRVAEGDYAVRIAPMRGDGKKDEFEVLYEDFNSMASQLEGKAILREDFLANISHEFRTPLSVINNYVTVLQGDTLTEEQRLQIIERIRLASEQLSGMVGNVLQISRLENNNITPQESVFDLSEQLVRTILSFDLALEERVRLGDISKVIVKQKDKVLFTLPVMQSIAAGIGGILFAPYAVIPGAMIAYGQVTVELEKTDGTILDIHGKPVA